MLGNVTIIRDFLLEIFSELELWVVFIALILREHFNQIIKMTLRKRHLSCRGQYLNEQREISFAYKQQMRFIYRSLYRFSLDHSNLKPSVTKSGLRNLKIHSSPLIEGYLTKNGNSKPKMHTVVMIHEWWGFNESITKTAETLSSNNIRVFVPDLYRGQAANSAQEAGHKMSNLNWPKALEDLSTIKNHFAKESQSVSVVGFCMGGALTFAALSSIQGWKAGGVFYGIPDLNIFRLDKITAKVVAHFGALDPLKGFSDIESAKKLKADCLREKYPVDVHIYEGSNHAFCNQDSVYFNSQSRDTAFDLTRKAIEG